MSSRHGAGWAVGHALQWNREGLHRLPRRRGGAGQERGVVNRRAFLSGLGLTSLLLAPLLVTAQAPPAVQSPHGDLAGDCATCHTAEGWSPLRKPLPFDHQGTGFPL